ncbi:hypothetical protein KR032_002540, partial [Drosophila birchii]
RWWLWVTGNGPANSDARVGNSILCKCLICHLAARPNPGPSQTLTAPQEYCRECGAGFFLLFSSPCLLCSRTQLLNHISHKTFVIILLICFSCFLISLESRNLVEA